MVIHVPGCNIQRIHRVLVHWGLVFQRLERDAHTCDGVLKVPGRGNVSFGAEGRETDDGVQHGDGDEIDAETLSLEEVHVEAVARSRASTEYRG